MAWKPIRKIMAAACVLIVPCRGGARGQEEYHRQDVKQEAKKEMKTMDTQQPSANKLRILCLHGYHGSGDILREQTAEFTSGLDSLADFVYADAPSLRADDFGWWHAVPADDSDMRGDPGVPPGARRYKGWARTRDWLVATFAQQGPFDGVLGFSQGAACTGLLTGLRSPTGKPTADKPLVFGFAIMAGGFLSADTALSALYRSKDSYAIPSLHIMGRSDGIVPEADSKALAAQFKDPVILEHDGGHVVAATPAIRKAAKAFLTARLEEKRRSAAPSHERSQPSPARPAGSARPARPTRPMEVPLWPGRAHPSMKLAFPSAAGGEPVPAMLVFQGGAYSTCFGSGGGSEDWLAGRGVAGIRVEYATKITNGSYPANYADAARAMRLVRAHAAEWGIDPHRIGVLGYSAGGHLASLLSTQPKLWLDPKDDLADSIPARPDLVALAYPVISFVDGYSPGAFVGTAENFLGRTADRETRERFSNELHVGKDHPPVFIWTTRDDALVPYTHSEKFAEACRRAGVPVRYTLYAHGRHGMGLALGERSEAAGWTDAFLAWLDERWNLRR